MYKEELWLKCEKKRIKEKNLAFLRTGGGEISLKIRLLKIFVKKKVRLIEVKINFIIF